MVLFLEWLGLIMSGDGLKVVIPGMTWLKMSFGGSVSEMAWFINVRGRLEGLTFLE